MEDYCDYNRCMKKHSSLLELDLEESLEKVSQPFLKTFSSSIWNVQEKRACPEVLADEF